MRVSFPKERKWRVLLEQISPVTGPKQTPIRWAVALWYVSTIRTLTCPSTNNYSLRTCSEPRIIEISLAKQVTPTPYHGEEWGSSSLVSQNLLLKIWSFVTPLLSPPSHPSIYTLWESNEAAVCGGFPRHVGESRVAFLPLRLVFLFLISSLAEMRVRPRTYESSRAFIWLWVQQCDSCQDRQCVHRLG